MLQNIVVRSEKDISFLGSKMAKDHSVVWVVHKIKPELSAYRPIW